MSNNRKKAVLILTLSLFILVGSLSYALWTNYNEQTTANVINAGCFAITFEEQTNAIGLIDTYPISDQQGSTLKPYIFTVKNTCTIAARYDINLDILEGTTFSMDSLKIKIDYEEPHLISSLDQETTTSQGVISSYYLKSGILAPASAKGAEDGGEMTHYLRLWIDSSVTQMEQQLMSKIVVKASAYTAQIIANGDISQTKECLTEDECTPVTGNDVYFEYYDDGTLLIKGNGAAAIESDNTMLSAEVFTKYLASNPNFMESLTEGEQTFFESEEAIYLMPLLAGNYKYFCQALGISEVTNNYDYIELAADKIADNDFLTFAQKIITDFPEIKRVIIAEGITELGPGSLSSLGPITVELPSSLIAIGPNAFLISEVNLTYKVNSHLREIKPQAFIASQMEQLALPNSVEVISQNILQGSTIKKIGLPQNNNFTIINDSMFTEALNIEEIIIPPNVTEIYTKAFYEQDIEHLELKFIGPQRVITNFNPNNYHVLWNYQES